MLQNEFVIQDLETLKALSHSLRLDMIKLFKEPKTVKQLAENMQRLPTKLYYHVNLLEQQGIIRIVDTKIVSGIVEKTYQLSARSFRVDEKLLTDPDQKSEKLEAVLDLLIEGTRTELRRSLQAEDFDHLKKNKNLIRTHYRLTEQEAEAFQKKIEALTEEYDQLSANREANDLTKIYNLTALFFPIVNPYDS